MLQALLDQRARGFADFAGTDIAATIPIADAWLNEQIARSLPADGVVRELQLRSRAGNAMAARVRVTKGSITLPIEVVLAIESQPDLPHRPTLGLRFTEAPMFLTLGGPLLQMFKVLPRGIAMDGDRVTIDLAALLANYGLSDVLGYVSELRITTADAALVLTLRLRIDQPTRAKSTSQL